MSFARLHDRRGFTLGETMLALVISSTLIYTTFLFFSPQLTEWSIMRNHQGTRMQIAATLEAIARDAENTSSIYIDSNQCWAVCIVDPTIAQRTIYYWGSGANANTLYRKSESSSNLITCTGGKAISTGLDKTNSKFSMSTDLLTVSLAGTDAYNHTYQATSTFFPPQQERDIIFYEGFECDTVRNVWTITTGSGSTWAVLPGSHFGQYEIVDTATTAGNSTTTLEVPLDLSRMSNAHLSFNYRNSGTINSTDYFQVYLYDGTTYQLVYNDTNGKSIADDMEIHVDLTPYSLNGSNKIKITSQLSAAGAKWLVDNVRVFTP